MFRATLEVPLPFEEGELTDDEDDGEDGGGSVASLAAGGSGGGGGAGVGGKGGEHGSSDDESEDGDHNLSRLSVGLADETQLDETSVRSGRGGEPVGRRNSLGEPGGAQEAGLSSTPRGPVGGVPASPLRGVRASVDDELRRISVEIPVGAPASPLTRQISVGLEAIQKLVDREPDL